MNTWRNASLVATAAALLALTTACGQDQGYQSQGGQTVGKAAPAQGGYGNGDAYGSGDGYGDAKNAGATKAKPAGQLATWD
ncbi:hypothetical protein ACFRLW_46560, partial [Streptomyces sp. NPDC056728]